MGRGWGRTFYVEGIIRMKVQSFTYLRNRDADVENGLVDTIGERECRTKGESSSDNIQ